ncbi:cob(II)yrinic acid a,c-diamide reductase [Chitinophaga polysaccharea]|uniref:Cob(II)yrinic acid a,c-diamide reductase n=1 Tax=Chitinophaga polysaccharea TaxID=1293035 RepID=A0A561PLF1_9BACT|nr:5,6-dimethylbenzimidazole synthase [Chitinophaga polysaccharea]TWF38941.1 cob(II)yrinic acid a,c-diamide reductase [Chitinophaga polysaccharea]
MLYLPANARYSMEGKYFDEAAVSILQDIILHRRDVRGNRFLSVPLEEAVIDQLLTAALHAPSVGFSQPWEFVLIRDEVVKQQVRNSFQEENSRAIPQFSEEKQPEYIRLKLEGIMEAPLNIAVFYKPSDKPVLGQTAMSEAGLYSVVCAVQNMWLMARALNIGIGWVSILDPEKVKQVLRAPSSNKLVAYLCVGYTDGFFTQPELEILQWEKRKMKEAVVFKEGY